MCKTMSGDKFQIQTYYNTRGKTSLAYSYAKTLGLSELAADFSNGVFICEFKREKKLDDTDKFFDISSSKYYLFVAKGPLSNTGNKY